MLLGMFCSSAGKAATGNALRERNRAHSQRGHRRGSGDSRLISAAATRGLFAAGNKRRGIISAAFSGLLGRRLPEGLPQEHEELASQVPGPSAVDFLSPRHLLLTPLPPKP